MRSLLYLGLAGLGLAALPEHLVERVPGFDRVPFKVYSGLLQVPGPLIGYDSLEIHYQFHECQGYPQAAPVVAWSNGGPGASSILTGQFTEMGYFQIDDNGPHTNPHAWNRLANMLYLEAPAGSGRGYGYSACIRDGQAVGCVFDDVTQGEAYAHALRAFFEGFPEYGENDLYLAGESYFGQYGTNIAHFILNNEPFKHSLNLKGMALGNACWGGSEDSVECNGPNHERNDVELFYGKGLFSPKTYKKIKKFCQFPDTSSPDCEAALDEYAREIGPYNVYNVYDNCPQTDAFLEETGKDMRWLLTVLRKGLSSHADAHKLFDTPGGFTWGCVGQGRSQDWIVTPSVREALHLGNRSAGASSFTYNSSGPAAITLYPELVKRLRLLIFNGDADACVPYIGNMEWIQQLEDGGVLKESKEWTPWSVGNSSTAPAGYVTEYEVLGGNNDYAHDFTFTTLRLAGHMTPTFQPEASFVMFERWLSQKSLAPTGSAAGDSCASRDAPSEDPYEHMCYLAHLNGALYDIHFSEESGHPNFDNHLAYYLVALYRLGANASRLQAAFDSYKPVLAEARPATGFITDDNWVPQVGAWQRGETANASIHYSDYVEFFRGKIASLGPEETLQWAMPFVADGVEGSLFHAVIQVGYYYESGDSEVLAEGLAWMATAFTRLGDLNSSPTYTDMKTAMEHLRNDHRLPNDLSVSALSDRYSHVLAEYDLSIDDEPSLQTVELFSKQISMAALELFAVDGYADFVLLHVCTGTRAVQVILGNLTNPRTQAQLLRRHWSAMLHYYVAHGRPRVETPKVDDSKLRTWPELAASAVQQHDSHLVKLVYLCRENDEAWNEPLNRQVAERIVARFEAGLAWSHGKKIGKHSLLWMLSGSLCTGLGVVALGAAAIFTRRRGRGAEETSDLGTSLQRAAA